MSSSKKNKNKQPKNEPETSVQSSPRTSTSISSDTGKNGQTETKPSEKGFSILGSLAKFMSREKKRESVQRLEPLIETEEEHESTPQESEFSDMSSQTSELNVRRSSTLNAISTAVDTLKELRQRIEVLTDRKETDSSYILQPEETQTSNFYIPEESTYLPSHDPYILLKNRTLPEDYEDTTSDNDPPSMLHVKSVEVLHKDKRPSRVLFKGDPEIYEVEASPDVPSGSKRSYKAFIADTKESITDVRDEDNGEILFQSSPNTSIRKSKSVKLHLLTPLKLSHKSEDSQTEPEMEIRGTQTSWSHAVNNDQSERPIEPSDNEQSLIRKLLTDREKCPKCDLFELMFLHGGDKVLNDKEMLEMFKKHMNSHLLKAQKDLDKQYKWPGRITQIEDVTDTALNQGKSVDQKQVKENAVTTRSSITDNATLNLHHENNAVGIPQEGKLGTTSHQRQITADNDGSEAVIEQSANFSHAGETKGLRRDLSRTRHRLLQPYSYPSDDQPLMNFGGLKEDCSEEIIIRRNHCRDGRRRLDSVDCDNGQCYSRHKGNDGMKSDKRHHKQFEQDSWEDKNCECRCFCERVTCKSVSSNCDRHYCNLNIDKDDCNCRNKRDESYFSTRPRQGENEKEMEYRLKWFVKGMLTALKGHFNNNNNSTRRSGGDNKKERELVSDSRQGGTTEKRLDGTEKATNTQESPSATGNSLSPVANQEKILPLENEKGRNREGSVLSSMVTSITRENKEKDNGQNDVQNDKPDSISERPDITKESFEQQTALKNNPMSDPERNKSEANNKFQKGKSIDDLDNGSVFHKNINLKDPSIQELLKDVLSVLRMEYSFHESGVKGKSDGDFPLCDSGEIIQQVCDKLLHETPNKRRTSTQFSRPIINTDESYKESRFGTNSIQQRTTCSYFPPLCSDNVINTSNQFYYNQDKPCFCPQKEKERKSCNRKTEGLFSLQEAFKRNHPGCYHRLKTRQECISNCTRDRENSETQRRHRMESLLGALTSSPPTSDFATRRRGNILCDMGTNIFTASDENAGDPVTYVVPRSQVYWRSF